VQLDLYTQIILSVLSVYQSANKSIDTNMLTGLHWLKTGYNDGFLHNVMKIWVLSDIEILMSRINISFSKRF
jgi:hypothetical protein